MRSFPKNTTFLTSYFGIFTFLSRSIGGVINTANQRSLWDLGLGESSRIQSFSNMDIANKFLSVGMVPNTELTLVRYSPFKSTLCIRLGDTHMALRNQEAKCILID